MNDTHSHEGDIQLPCVLPRPFSAHFKTQPCCSMMQPTPHSHEPSQRLGRSIDPWPTAHSFASVAAPCLSIHASTRAVTSGITSLPTQPNILCQEKFPQHNKQEFSSVTQCGGTVGRSTDLDLVGLGGSPVSTYGVFHSSISSTFGASSAISRDVPIGWNASVPESTSSGVCSSRTKSRLTLNTKSWSVNTVITSNRSESP